MEKIVCRSIFVWICFVSVCIGMLYKQTKMVSPFYNIGPNSVLVILGFNINNYTKYSLIVGYCVINSVFRSLFHNILIPWVTNSIQDITKPKPINIHIFAYESAFIITIYTWFDWFLYYNILISQIDLLIIEISMDVIMAGIITNYYINYKIPLTNKNKMEYDSLL